MKIDACRCSRQCLALALTGGLLVLLVLALAPGAAQAQYNPNCTQCPAGECYYWTKWKSEVFSGCCEPGYRYVKRYSKSCCALLQENNMSWCENSWTLAFQGCTYYDSTNCPIWLSTPTDEEPFLESALGTSEVPVESNSETAAWEQSEPSSEKAPEVRREEAERLPILGLESERPDA